MRKASRASGTSRTSRRKLPQLVHLKDPKDQKDPKDLEDLEDLNPLSGADNFSHVMSDNNCQSLANPAMTQLSYARATLTFISGYGSRAASRGTGTTVALVMVTAPPVVAWNETRTRLKESEK
jgi:hypothetical protein